MVGNDFRTACERISSVMTAWRVMKRAHWPSGAVSLPLCRPCIDLTVHRDHTGEQILVDFGVR